MNTDNEKRNLTALLERDGVIHSQQNVIKVEKPYTLRRLTAKDISPMVKILKKVELSRLKDVFSDLDFSDIINKENEQIEDLKEEEIEKFDTDTSKVFAKIGENLIFGAIPMLLEALDNCLEDINKLLASVANLQLDEVENMELDTYFNLIYDFINKEEFMGFLKVASRFLKSEN